MFEKLLPHVGHNIEIVTYNFLNGEAANVSCECLTCNEVLTSADYDEEDEDDDINYLIAG